ncbi:MAG: hypothetical protein JST39_11630, partial [Bacteroidetes bacterium]|nr:hypothetical protein [Bacteroidota bacterium]
MKQAIRNIILLLLIYIPAAGQDAGTKTPYPAPGKRCTPPPPGYAPVFINHVGRHGARFLTKAGSDVETLQLLELAKTEGALTAEGQAILRMVIRFLSIEQDNYENITLLGREEQAAIASRMLHRYPQVFTGRGLELIMTHKVRTQQSAEAFASGLGDYKGKKNYRVVPDSLDNTLRFYDLSPAYIAFRQNPLLRRSIDSLNNDPKTAAVSANVCARMFTPAFASRLHKGIVVEIKQKKLKIDAVSFTENLYDLYCVQLSIPLEMRQKGYAKDSI